MGIILIVKSFDQQGTMSKARAGWNTLYVHMATFHRIDHPESLFITARKSCRHHNLGYCKFQERCLYFHKNKNCPTDLHHPKNGKFGSKCSFGPEKCLSSRWSRSCSNFISSGGSAITISPSVIISLSNGSHPNSGNNGSVLSAETPLTSTSN